MYIYYTSMFYVYIYTYIYIYIYINIYIIYVVNFMTQNSTFLDLLMMIHNGWVISKIDGNNN